MSIHEIRRVVRTACGLAYDYPVSMAASLLQREPFSDLQAYCMFIGYPRSGHSLIGALLDAHPDAVVAHELGVLKYVRAGFSRRQIFFLLMRRSRRFAKSGRHRGGYYYNVPGQWQGDVRTLRIIGDKKAGGATLRWREKPSLLDRLRRTVRVPVKCLHVVRNPYDNITTLYLRGAESGIYRQLDQAIDAYFTLCETVQRIKAVFDAHDMCEFRHEEFIGDPSSILRRVCRFLDISPDPSYIDACTQVVFTNPSRSRDKIEWTATQVDRVRREIDRYPFLAGYTYDD